ncbi:type VII secretion target [Kitasatospora sp. NPDC057542]|uniref:type VII secretion target n=1 Tax=Kitasatospora sp. NPDC057542 TaxID=3346162 RepID=UPI0036CB42EA
MPNPDLASELKVNPAELDGCGQSAQHIGSLIPGETSKVTEPNNQAANGLRGWQMAAAIQGCATNWKTLLDKLGADMGDVGTKLAASATYYRQVEKDIHASLKDPNAPAGDEPDPFGTVVLPVPVKPYSPKAAE